MEGTIPTYKTPRENIFLKYYEAGQQGETLWIEEFGGERIKEHYRYLATLSISGDKDKTIKEDVAIIPERQFDHVAYFKYGYLLFITLDPAPNAHEVFKRFAKEFEQTYTRFLDLKKAEAQAREAEIQLALERVRARAMAMHTSEDMGECILKMFGELTALGVDESTRFGIGILNHDNANNQLWTARKEGEEVKMHIGHLDMTLHPLLQSARKAWQQQVPLHRYILEGDDLLEYYHMLNRAPDYKLRVAIEKLPEREFHYGFIFDHGFFYAFSVAEFQPDLIHIAQRFSALFEQTYRRYLDLRRAEEQAREAQIEAALEKIRSSGNALRHTSELVNTATVMFNQLDELGIHPWRCGSAIVTEDEERLELWSATTTPHERNVGVAGDTKISGHWVTIGAYKAVKDQDPIYIYDLSADQLIDYLDYISRNFNIAESSQSVDKLPQRLVYYCAVFSHGLVYGAFLEPIGKDIQNILIRFAKVFEQAYTRFLDLKKAEEQARESQIQLALERVRARTMAMQKSGELAEVVQELFSQIGPLDPAAQWGCAILLADEVREGFHLWFSVPTNPLLPESIFLHHGDNQVIKKCWKAYQEQTAQFRLELEGEAKEKWDEHLFSTTNMQKLPAEMQQAIRSEKYVMFSFARMRHGLIEAISHQPISAALDELLPRFAKVFEQTYTRFLDLQRAEEQAREKEIQLALERVRSKTMAMHKSADLRDVVYVMFQQVSALDLADLGCNINLFHPENRIIETWLAGSDQEPIPKSYYLQVEHPYVNRMWDSWEQQDEPFCIYSTGKDHETYKNLIIDICYQDMPEEFKDYIRTNPEAYFHHINMQCGQIQTVSTSRQTADKVAILQRFAAVFQQSYTRFLDLDRAEAQAREAEIQLSLERVRARTMAMHRSEELADATTVLFHQIRELGINAASGWISIVDPVEDSMTIYLRHGNLMGTPTKVFGEMHANFRQEIDSWKAGEEFLKLTNTKEEFIASVERIFATTVTAPPGKDTFHLLQVHHKFGFLGLGTWDEATPDEYAIYRRFANVFEQTYTRFLDLQKAEAQAREAQIEAALEKVRSRTMGMRHSDELTEAAQLLFREVQALGIPAWSCGYNILSADKLFCTSIMSAEGELQEPLEVPLTEHESFLPWHHALLNHDEFLVYRLEGKALEAHYQYMQSLPGFNEFERSGIALPACQINHLVRFKQGFLLFIASEEIPEAHDVFRRFGVVFNQTYTRFLDLQKAEEQARESEIQLALERVRARTMAMHKSDELRSVIHTVFEQIKALGFDATACGLTLFNQDDKSMVLWLAGFDTEAYPESYFVPYFDHPLYNAQYNAWESGQAYQVFKFEGELKKSYDDLIFELGGYKDLPPSAKEAITSIETATNCTAFMKYGMFESVMIGNETLTQQQADTLQRFAKVFEQTYTRFLDLQKAEAQAREAQIEAAMERIRSRAIAMHSSEDLKEVIIELRKQIDSLGELDLEASVIHLYPDHEPMFESIAAVRPPGESGEIVLANVHFPVDAMDQIKHMIEMYHSGASEYTIEFNKEMAEEWQQVMVKHAPMIAERRVGFVNNRRLSDHSEFWNFADFSEGSLLLVTHSPASNDTKTVLKRAAKVFDIAYRRFRDLQRAEAQAREAQIEAALERIRASAMAMHTSSDLQKVVEVIFREMEVMNLKILRCGIGIIHAASRTADVWTTTQTDSGMEVNVSGNESLEIHPVLQGAFLAWQKQEDFYYTFTIEDLEAYHQALQDANFLLPDGARSDTYQYYFATFFPAGGIYTFTPDPLTENTTGVIRRFARAFSLAYQRFQDLQNAEQQAREAQIEAALERVRSRTMGMQRSDELPETAILLFQQIQSLGIPVWSTAFNIYNEDKRSVTCNVSSQGQLQPAFRLPLTEEKSFVEWYEAVKANRAFFVQELEGKDLEKHYAYLLGVPGVMDAAQPLQDAGIALPTHQINHLCTFKQGFLVFITYEQVPEGKAVFTRFSAVFEQTYTRFLDLKKAEAQAQEAIKQASLDRIRGEIASMRTAEDLERITPLVWKELMALNVPFIRCGVFIMDEEEEIIHNYLSTPDGQAIATFHLPFTTPGAITNILHHWQKRKKLIDHWDKQDMLDFANILVGRGIFASVEQYLQTLPPEGFYLHFLPFNQGMLYVGNTAKLHDVQINLLQALAKAFSTAYARYEDFNRLEVAKKQVENTLIDLKQAQQQLIQSEKMASLGELTAGIAHEIQNPLNFVNNFSEVNQELISELKGAIARKDSEETEQLLQDLLDNEEKVKLHGKRAEGIVRSMLQHSRTSSGQKVETDINSLCDEYLRLAYHGFRAKDKSFNAQLETNFDPELPRIEIVSQEIGRVLLNLINNAFQACTEYNRSTTSDPSYKPFVSVSTKYSSSANGGKGGVEITVTDNGPGIPDSIKDKIFQPFFTTKPTGQGTGLGLSLAYDIVKAHGGTLDVESREGQGSTFIIKL
ncbi:MAG: hypothetical protein KDC57_04625 [Saprospiraceae bacterium]|nr:hypothetical protein [Saprospiraceae bacterium]